MPGTWPYHGVLGSLDLRSSPLGRITAIRGSTLPTRPRRDTRTLPQSFRAAKLCVCIRLGDVRKQFPMGIGGFGEAATRSWSFVAQRDERIDAGSPARRNIDRHRRHRRQGDHHGAECDGVAGLDTEQET